MEQLGDQDPAPPDPPAAVDAVFGDRAPLAVRYVAHLNDTGVRHGLIGPRERPRLWERHVLNCAVAADLIDRDQRVADVGSGAGLPGIVLAIARPDLQITLIEPLLRRVTWLQTVVDDLQLPNVTIDRARAEQRWGELAVDVVTARAVARLEELARWSLPLLRPHGTMLALKGSSADQELAAARSTLARAGVVDAKIVTCGARLLEQPTVVVRLTIGDDVQPVPVETGHVPSRASGRRRRGRRSGRR